MNKQEKHTCIECGQNQFALNENKWSCEQCGAEYSKEAIVKCEKCGDPYEKRKDEFGVCKNCEDHALR